MCGGGAQQPAWRSADHVAAIPRAELDSITARGRLLAPRADSDYFGSAARALDIARKDFGKATRPYNAMVIQADDAGAWFVYLVPAPTIAGVWPLGGDMRYRVTRDGRTITDRRRLHNAVLEFPPASKPQAGSRLVAGSHAAVLADRPEDTDVFHVLTREPRVPEYIVTRSYYFRVDVNGHIAAFVHLTHDRAQNPGDAFT